MGVADGEGPYGRSDSLVGMLPPQKKGCFCGELKIQKETVTDVKESVSRVKKPQLMQRSSGGKELALLQIQGREYRRRG